MASSYLASLGAGLAQGGAQAADYAAGKEQRDLALSQAKLQQKQAESQFAEYQAQQPNREKQAELQLNQMQNQVTTQNKQLVKQAAIDGIGRYNADGDVRHLNTWMQQVKQNPVGQKLHGNVLRFDPITKSTATDKLLKQAGFTDLDTVYNNTDKVPNLVLVTRTNGEQVLGDMHDIEVRTGYTKYMSDQDLEKRERESVITQRLKSGVSPDKSDRMDKVIASIRESNPDITYAQAYEQVQGMGKTNMSSEESAIRQIMKDQGVQYLEAAEQYYKVKKGSTGMTDRDKFKQDYLAQNAQDPNNPTPQETMDANAAYDKRTPTSAQKEVGSIEEVKDRLDELGLFEMDLGKSTVKEKAQVHRLIGQIEDLRGIQFGTEEKRVIRDFKNLTQLAGTVGEELSEEQTGLLDNMLSQAKGYLLNEVGGKKASSAYATFRNNMRRTLSGQSLTEGEIKAFEQAAGSLKLQLKPALAQFRTQVQTVKAQLEAIRDLNDPYLAQYYVGQDIGEIDDVIRNLDARLGDIARIATKGTKQTLADTKLSFADRIKAQGVPAPATSQPTSTLDLDELYKQAAGAK